MENQKLIVEVEIKSNIQEVSTQAQLLIEQLQKIENLSKCDKSR